jgi:hypothetical protein
MQEVKSAGWWRIGWGCSKQVSKHGVFNERIWSLSLCALRVFENASKGGDGDLLFATKGLFALLRSKLRAKADSHPRESVITPLRLQ